MEWNDTLLYVIVLPSRVARKRTLFFIWCGTMRSRIQFYKSKTWQKARDAYVKKRISIDGGLCEVCGCDYGLIVHHKIWLTDENYTDPDIALNPENFRYECQSCHNREQDPSKARSASRRYFIDDLGEIHPLSDD